ncbi:NHL repeat-containing protein [Mucilaginibacter agri]|uniref:NHL repeat-containing protein n=1 Tax=Mucilaginibacter agri TaxID=2695265 RepID=A0A965ZFH1_9SPHI|nr:hypothetical protein [Mucilaginibacter agri]NCD68822.1 hypothetical protein [Mucilaginibacter agri]
MKSKFIWLTSLILITIFTNCKKSEQAQPSSSSTDQDPFMVSNSVSVADIGTTNKVITIAGKANTSGSADGAGSIARFNHPMGIQLLKDGSLYVADEYNDVIRKITPEYQVSTENLNTGSYGSLLRPLYVGEDDKKNLHVIGLVEIGGGGTQQWLFDPGRNVLASDGGFYITHACLAKDPYADFFWSSSGYGIFVSYADVLNIPQHSINESTLFGDPNEENERGFRLTGLFTGRNNVIYFAHNTGLYKHTPSGVDALINTGTPLGNITSIVLNADCKTMYLAADGYIKRIVNGTVSKLAGPNTAHPDGRDGVGFDADVNANSLALGDHENALYFSDTKTHTIKKLQLK